jgi:hypothetical protein
MSSEFYKNTLQRQIRTALRADPELADNPNGLVLAIWQNNGLKLRRRQLIGTFMLPEIDDIFDAAEKVLNDVQPAKAKTVTTEPDPDFLAMENEPKPGKIIKVKNAPKK